MRSLSTSAFGQPSETSPTVGARFVEATARRTLGEAREGVDAPARARDFAGVLTMRACKRRRLDAQDERLRPVTGNADGGGCAAAQHKNRVAAPLHIG